MKILRCVNTNEYDSTRDKALVDFIIQKTIQNPKLRDETFIQIINQTWVDNNHQKSIADNEANVKAWQLMSYCLSSFVPSSILYKYLLK